MTVKKPYKNKRFIAGAACPGCGEIDKLFTYVKEAEALDGSAGPLNDVITYRACTRCDLDEPLLAATQKQELPTRVNRPIAERESADQVVKLVDI